MIKIKNKLTIVAIILLMPVALIILFILGSFAISPIFDYFEKQNFTILDLESQKISAAIKGIAGPDEIWKYNTGCGNNYTGPWHDGSYQCVTISYMEKNISDADEVMQLHEKYYSIIDSQGSLVADRDLEFVNGDTFGKKFVISSASKAYKEKKTNISCRYESYFGQSDLSSNGLSYEYGSEIKAEKGTLTIMFRCEGTTGKTWYPKIIDASGMIPDFTPYF